MASDFVAGGARRLSPGMVVARQDRITVWALPRAFWLGLLLTTAPEPFPLGLPFALAGPSFTIGWRLMYIIATVLCILGILLRTLLPESSRWLVSTGQVEKADEIVRRMEERAARKQ